MRRRAGNHSRGRNPQIGQGRPGETRPAVPAGILPRHRTGPKTNQRQPGGRRRRLSLLHSRAKCQWRRHPRGLRVLLPAINLPQQPHRVGGDRPRRPGPLTGHSGMKHAIDPKVPGGAHPSVLREPDAIPRDLQQWSPLDRSATTRPGEDRTEPDSARPQGQTLITSICGTLVTVGRKLEQSSRSPGPPGTVTNPPHDPRPGTDGPRFPGPPNPSG